MSRLLFTDWIAKHTHRDSPLGDLARDIQSDKEWPERVYDIEFLQHLIYYICYKAKWDGPKEALKSAISSYKNYLRSHNLVSPYRDIEERLDFHGEHEGAYLDLLAYNSLKPKS